MKKSKKITVIISVVFATILLAAGAFFAFDYYKFYNLETFSTDEIDEVCLTMSGIEDDVIEKYALPFGADDYMLCRLEDENKHAVFIIEKVYFHNKGKEARYKVKFESVEEEQDISSMSFRVNDDTEVIIYYWKNNIPVRSADYTLERRESSETEVKTIENESFYNSGYFYIDYFYNDYAVKGINFYDDAGNIIFTEQRATGYENELIEN